MTRMMIQLPWNLKTKLDAFRKQGTTASGYIRHLFGGTFQTAFCNETERTVTDGMLNEGTL